MSTQEIKEYTENLNLNKQASNKKQKKRNRKYLDTQDWITIIFLILAFLFVFQDFIF